MIELEKLLSEIKKKFETREQIIVQQRDKIGKLEFSLSELQAEVTRLTTEIQEMQQRFRKLQATLKEVT